VGGNFSEKLRSLKNFITDLFSLWLAINEERRGRK
jgi:hypothetical protein